MLLKKLIFVIMSKKLTPDRFTIVSEVFLLEHSPWDRSISLMLLILRDLKNIALTYGARRYLQTFFYCVTKFVLCSSSKY